MANHYSLVFSALYGMSFIEGTKAGWYFFKQHSLDVVFSESFLGGISTTVSLLGAAFCCASQIVLLPSIFAEHLDLLHLIYLSFISGVVGYGVCNIVMEQIWASCVTLLVVMRESPKQFQVSFKEFSWIVSEIQDMCAEPKEVTTTDVLATAAAMTLLID
jgi:hypothetical protein